MNAIIVLFLGNHFWSYTAHGRRTLLFSFASFSWWAWQFYHPWFFQTIFFSLLRFLLRFRPLPALSAALPPERVRLLVYLAVSSTILFSPVDCHVRNKSYPLAPETNYSIITFWKYETIYQMIGSYKKIQVMKYNNSGTQSIDIFMFWINILISY